MPKWYVQGSPTLWLRIRNRIEEIANLITYKKYPRLVEPKILGEIDHTAVYELFRYLNVKRIFLADEKYQITNITSIINFLKLDETNKRKYAPIWHDCDDFSFRLIGQFHRGKWAHCAIGIAWSPSHAYNVFITKDPNGNLEVYAIEPQTDVIRKLPSDVPYDTWLVIM